MRFLVGNVPAHHRVAQPGRHCAFLRRILDTVDVWDRALVQRAAKLPGQQSAVLHHLEGQEGFESLNWFCQSFSFIICYLTHLFGVPRSGHERRHVKQPVVDNGEDLHVLESHTREAAHVIQELHPLF